MGKWALQMEHTKRMLREQSGEEAPNSLCAVTGIIAAYDQMQTHTDDKILFELGKSITVTWQKYVANIDATSYYGKVLYDGEALTLAEFLLLTSWGYVESLGVSKVGGYPEAEGVNTCPPQIDGEDDWQRYFGKSMKEGDAVEVQQDDGKWVKGNIAQVRSDGTFDVDCGNECNEIKKPAKKLRRVGPGRKERDAMSRQAGRAVLSSLASGARQVRDALKPSSLAAAARESAGEALRTKATSAYAEVSEAADRASDEIVDEGAAPLEDAVQEDDDSGDSGDGDSGDGDSGDRGDRADHDDDDDDGDGNGSRDRGPSLEYFECPVFHLMAISSGHRKLAKSKEHIAQEQKVNSMQDYPGNQQLSGTFLRGGLHRRRETIPSTPDEPMILGIFCLANAELVHRAFRKYSSRARAKTHNLMMGRKDYAIHKMMEKEVDLQFMDIERHLSNYNTDVLLISTIFKLTKLSFVAPVILSEIVMVARDVMTLGLVGVGHMHRALAGLAGQISQPFSVRDIKSIVGADEHIDSGLVDVEETIHTALEGSRDQLIKVIDEGKKKCKKDLTSMRKKFIWKLRDTYRHNENVEITMLPWSTVPEALITRTANVRDIKEERVIGGAINFVARGIKLYCAQVQPAATFSRVS